MIIITTIITFDFPFAGGVGVLGVGVAAGTGSELGAAASDAVGVALAGSVLAAVSVDGGVAGAGSLLGVAASVDGGVA